MPRYSTARKIIRRNVLTRRLEDERAWMRKCGGDLEGYAEAYGLKSEPDHVGDGAEAIYAADLAAVARIEAEIAAL